MTDIAKVEQSSHLFAKGRPKTGGRKKGTPNKRTALLKDAILEAAQQAGGGDKEGLVNYLTARALDNPVAFMALLGKVLPMQVTGDDDSGPIRVVINRYADREADAEDADMLVSYSAGGA